MDNAQMFLLEKQASRRPKPMSPAAMVRFYSRPKKRQAGLLQTAANFLIAAGQKLQAQGQAKAAPPAFQSK
jgi:hypothetical protein